MITDDILADAKSSGMILDQGQLPDCFYCSLKKRIIQNHGMIKIAKPNGKIIAFMRCHHNQDLNLPALRYQFEQFLQKNRLPDKFVFSQVEGHWIAELCSQGGS